MAKLLGRHPIALAALALSLLTLGSGCALLDPDEEDQAKPLQVTLSLDEQALRDGPTNLLCAGSPLLHLGIEGGRSPYEAVILLGGTAGRSGPATQYGPVEAVPRVMLKQSFGGTGVFDLQHPAITFASGDPPTAQAAPIIFTALVKDRDSGFSFNQLVVGQTASAPQSASIRESQLVEMLRACQ